MVFMVHDSDPNVAKTCFVHVKSGGQIMFFDPHLKKWWVSWPRWSHASVVYGCELSQQVLMIRQTVITLMHYGIWCSDISLTLQLIIFYNLWAATTTFCYLLLQHLVEFCNTWLCQLYEFCVDAVVCYISE